MEVFSWIDVSPRFFFFFSNNVKHRSTFSIERAFKYFCPNTVSRNEKRNATLGNKFRAKDALKFEFSRFWRANENYSCPGKQAFRNFPFLFEPSSRVPCKRERIRLFRALQSCVSSSVLHVDIKLIFIFRREKAKKRQTRRIEIIFDVKLLAIWQKETFAFVI